MRPGWPLIEAMCKALDLPTDNLIGVKIDAWAPGEIIVVTTQYMAGIVDGEIEIVEQRWVPDGEPVRT